MFFVIILPNPNKVIWQKKEQNQKSPTTPAIIPQIILIKTTSVFNGGVDSKTVKIPKSLEWEHFAQIG